VAPGLVTKGLNIGGLRGKTNHFLSLKEVNQGDSEIWLFLKIGRNLPTKSSRRDLSIDMVVDRFIFKNIKMALFPGFTFIQKKSGEIT